MSENPQNTFFWRLLAWKTQFFPHKSAYFNVATTGVSEGACMCFVSLSVIKDTQQNYKALECRHESQKQNDFLTFFDTEGLYFAKKCLFRCCNTLRFHLSVQLLSFIIIGFMRWKSKVFWYRPENRKKNPSFDVLRPKTQFFFRKNCLFFVSRPCSSNKAANLWLWETLVWHSKIRNCSSAYPKTPKKPIFWDFWTKTQLFCIKLPFSFLV